jgi:hypothetical protein
MLKRLIEHVLKLEPESMSDLTLEDASICATWHASLVARPDGAGGWPELDAAVDAWLSLTPETTSGAARRTQWLLRDLIDLMASGEGEAFGWSELRFLQCVHDLSNRAAAPGQFDRVRQLLAPYQEAIRQRMRTLAPPSRGLPGIADRLHVVTTEDLEAGTPGALGQVEGLPVPFTGALTRRRGHVRVLGAVPSEAGLLVRDGSCRIDGAIRGCVAASGHCDSSGMLSGVAVAAGGDVRTQGIGEGAFVAARTGSVLCAEARGPRLVYAAREIQVGGDAAGGSYVSPRIRIAGGARGVRVMASRVASAELFGNAPNRQSVVVLRRRVSVLDVDEALDGDATRLVRLRDRADARAAALAHRAGQLEAEADQFARNAIFYICTSSKTHAHLFALQQAQTDLSVQRRLTDALLALVVALENQLDHGTEMHAAEAGAPEYADARKLAAAEPPAGPVAQRALERAATLWRELETGAADAGEAARRLRQARELLAAQMRNSHVSSVEAERHEGMLSEAGSRIPLLNDASASHPLNVLRRAVRNAAQTPKVAAKLHADFVRQMRGRAEAAANAANRHRTDARRLRSERNALQGRIEREHPGLLEAAAPADDAEAVVTGRFEAGVRICSDRFAADPAAARGADSALVTEETGGETIRVRRSAAGQLVRETDG